MRFLQLAAVVLAFLLVKPAMAQERILISSDWGQVTAELVDNDATRALVRMMPLTIEMRDHMRQEKTGELPASLPSVPRQTAFAKGTLGLWNSDHFVVYYRDGLLSRGSLSSGRGGVTSPSLTDRVLSPCGLSGRNELRLERMCPRAAPNSTKSSVRSDPSAGHGRARAAESFFSHFFVLPRFITVVGRGGNSETGLAR